MASNGLHDHGEEYAQRVLWRSDAITKDTTIAVGMYNDTTDALTDGSDVGAITTEPATGNYTRTTFTVDSADVTVSQAGGNIEISATVTIDTTNTTGTVDAWFTVVNFDADLVTADTAATDHLLASAPFGGGSIDLANFSSVDVTVTISLD